MKNGKLFSKFSVIDLAVILLILLVTVVLVIRMGWFSTPEVAVEQTATYETVECTVQLRFPNVTANLLSDPFTKGQALYIGNTKFGSIEQIRREAAQQRIVLRDGSVVTSDRKDAYNYIVTLKTTLTRKNGMLYFKNEPVAVGTGETFLSRYYAGKGYVISVEKTQ